MSRLVENGQVESPDYPGQSNVCSATNGLRRIAAPMAATAIEDIRHEVLSLDRLAGEQPASDLRQAWEAIRRCDACYRSPFFSYDFVAAVSQVGPRLR